MRAPLTLMALLLFSSAGFAAERTQYLHYAVKGSTAPEIYASIKKDSPRVAANTTFAFTAIATKTDKREAKAKGSCRYARFNTSAIYYITLPQLAKSSKVSAALRGSWQAFAAHLKTHEEWHRSNWQACLKDYDRKAAALAARDCNGLDRKRERLFTSIKKACVAKDEAFDFYFRKDVLKHPFIKAALKSD